MTDEALMMRVVAEEEGAFEELAGRFETRLYYFAYRHLRDADLSRDAVQETLLRVYRHRRDFKRGSRLSTWIFAILLNFCRDQLRKSSRLSSMEDPGVAAAAEWSPHRRSEVSPEAQAERGQIAQLLAEALESLPPLQAELMRLRTRDELSFEDAGAKLGISPQAARAAASRAYKKIKLWFISKVS